jgi:hypothetical protein
VAKAAITTDIGNAIEALAHFAPFSTHPDRRLWKSILLNLHEIEAVLLTMEAFAPGKLRMLEAAACDELQVEHGDPIQEVSDLVDRYCSRREKLR